MHVYILILNACLHIVKLRLEVNGQANKAESLFFYIINKKAHMQLPSTFQKHFFFSFIGNFI